ncbi:MAG: hypothetical protein JRD47_01945 [Deltaproteobacteria bacterium]|nr:hypothetical protein [Deltaproteobacteria bacterium]MBW2318735.1 hypothetical protein [Deltaproteobacteria bacterium]MBW2600682.1 hypothetical protein [Deltaproteobacteria bacterium]
MQGVKGEAVVVYADPLTTQQMRYTRLSRRVNNMAVFVVFWISLIVDSTTWHNKGRKQWLLLLLRSFCHVVYAT